MTCDELSEGQLLDLLDGILYNQKKESHMHFPSSSGWYRPPPKMSDQDFLIFLNHLATQKPELEDFTRKIQDIVHDWAIGKLRGMVSNLERRIKLIYEAQSASPVVQAKEQAKAKAKKEIDQRFSNFKEALRKKLSTDPKGLNLEIRDVCGELNRTSTSFKLKGVLDVELDAHIEYRIHPLCMREGDNTGMQYDPLFTASLWKGFGVPSFKLGLLDTIRHIQAIGNKILLIVETPSGIMICLYDPFLTDDGQAVGDFPPSPRRYHFCVREQQRLLAIVYIEPTARL
ncbi:hypothetical protein FRC03_011216 [Tulasnella sp. 419]|nr:hypothetical protein FRC03_011216 [Tulasnella sp. 419]